MARLQSSNFRVARPISREHLPSEQVLPKQLHSPLCFSISANIRKALKFRFRVTGTPISSNRNFPEADFWSGVTCGQPVMQGNTKRFFAVKKPLQRIADNTSM